jgi:Na+/H+-dicarboxylate symporter
MQKWRGPHRKKKKKKKKAREREKEMGKTTKAFTRSAPDELQRVAKYMVLVHALLLGFMLLFLLLLLRHRHRYRPLFAKTATARTLSFQY